MIWVCSGKWFFNRKQQKKNEKSERAMLLDMNFMPTRLQFYWEVCLFVYLHSALNSGYLKFFFDCVRVCVSVSVYVTKFSFSPCYMILAMHFMHRIEISVRWQLHSLNMTDSAAAADTNSKLATLILVPLQSVCTNYRLLETGLKIIIKRNEEREQREDEWEKSHSDSGLKL